MLDDMMGHVERVWLSGNSAEVVGWIVAPNSQGIGKRTRQPKWAVCGENKHPLAVADRFLADGC